jgi:hypothetical protein
MLLLVQVHDRHGNVRNLLYISSKQIVNHMTPLRMSRSIMTVRKHAEKRKRKTVAISSKAEQQPSVGTLQHQVSQR